MRSVALALLALLVLSQLPVAPAAVSTTLTLAAPAGVGVSTSFVVSGQYKLDTQGLPLARVDVFRDGVLTATTQTNENGQYSVLVLAPASPGVKVYHAVAQLAPGALVAQSPSRNVQVALPADAPPSLSATTNGVDRRVSLSWSATPDTHGAPLLRYQIDRWRAATGWSNLTNVSATTLAYDDATVAWSTAYKYRVHAVTFAGVGPASPEAPITMPAPTAGSIVVDTIWATICDENIPGCETIVPGTHNVHGPNVSVKGIVGGVLYTTGGEGMGGQAVATSITVTTPCALCSPTSGSATASGTTLHSNGRFSIPTGVAIAWTDFVVTECRSVTVAGSATSNALTSSGSASFTLCRVD